MKNFRNNSLLWMGLMGSLIFGTTFFDNVYQAFRGDQTIWWTPQAMRLPIEETKDNFDLYIGGVSLQKHLSDKTLFSVDRNGKQYPVVSKDVTVRLNNWDKTQSSILTITTMSGFTLGVSIALLVIGVIQAFHQGKKPD
jgi:hypothetical protein